MLSLFLEKEPQKGTVEMALVGDQDVNSEDMNFSWCRGPGSPPVDQGIREWPSGQESMKRCSESFREEKGEKNVALKLLL